MKTFLQLSGRNHTVSEPLTAKWRTLVKTAQKNVQHWRKFKKLDMENMHFHQLLHFFHPLDRFSPEIIHSSIYEGTSLNLQPYDLQLTSRSLSTSHTFFLVLLIKISSRDQLHRKIKVQRISQIPLDFLLIPSKDFSLNNPTQMSKTAKKATDVVHNVFNFNLTT